MVFEKDRATSEEYIRLYLRTFPDKATSMFELEVVVVVICLGTEADLLDHNLHRIALLLFELFLLLIDKLLVVNHPTNGRIGLCSNFYEVETSTICYA